MCKGYVLYELPDQEPFAQNIKFCLYIVLGSKRDSMFLSGFQALPTLVSMFFLIFH